MSISSIDKMPNTGVGIVQQKHIVTFDGLCPVSDNPKPGSYVEITYTPKEWFLEVYSLRDFVNSFTGGKRMGNERIRDMERTIQEIAAAAFEAVEVPVYVFAHLVLDAGVMELVVERG